MKKAMNIAIAMMIVLSSMLAAVALVPGTVEATTDCSAPQKLMATHDGTDVILSWTAPAVGTPIIYKVYEDSDNDITNGFDEDYLGSSTDRTFGGVDNELAGDYSDSKNHYYVVRAYDADFDESPYSNIGVKEIHTLLTVGANWNIISIPDNSYARLSDITSDPQFNGDNSIITNVAFHDAPYTGWRVRKLITPTFWLGDYEISQGAAIRIIAVDQGENPDATWRVVGSYNSEPNKLTLTTVAANWNIVSLPCNHAYTKLSDITSDPQFNGDNSIIENVAYWDASYSGWRVRKALSPTFWLGDFPIPQGAAIRIIAVDQGENPDETWTPLVNEP